MRVSIYKSPKGQLSLLLQASRGRGIPPVLLRDVPRDQLKARAADEIAKMRGQEMPGPG